MRGLAIRLVTASALALVAACGQQNDKSNGGKEFKTEQVAESPYPMRVFWGDTHLHTSNSVDAFGFGVRLGPEEAYRFARGEEVTSSGGLKARLSRPLDFLVIADHSDGLGVTRRIYEAPRIALRDPLLRRWHDLMHEGPAGSLKATSELIDRAAAGTLPANVIDPKAQEKGTRTIWTDYTRLAEQYNEPGKFSALIGFEYTLMPNGDNLHRVVVMRDGKHRADKVLPFSSLVGTKASDLWDYMDRYEKTTGRKVLAIPHNGNLSNGLMFEMTAPGGGAMDAAYARRRAGHEPLVEVTQIKGDGEAHPFLSPNDEFAGYGVDGWELGNLPMSAAKTDDMFAGEYAREALKRGLAIEAKTGVNPYKFGMIGSTDSHTALATGEEDNFFGKHSGGEPGASRALQPQNLGSRTGRFGWHYLAGGYAAVWAKANTREALFDAMMRREVYATTGPRMTVRFFGGWDFKTTDLGSKLVEAGYGRGVPMGSDMQPGPGEAPAFIVSALKDPEGANLDRAQIVKGWIDAKGALHERVYDVAWSDPARRARGKDGKVTPVGDTVNIAKATYANTIGAAELKTVWVDPDHDPKLKAFYYVRVLEIPTPRWPAYDAVRYKFKLPANVRAKSQERAYTSPIWYNPAG